MYSCSKNGIDELSAQCNLTDPQDIKFWIMMMKLWWKKKATDSLVVERKRERLSAAFTCFDILPQMKWQSECNYFQPIAIKQLWYLVEFTRVTNSKQSALFDMLNEKFLIKPQYNLLCFLLWYHWIRNINLLKMYISS